MSIGFALNFVKVGRKSWAIPSAIQSRISSALCTESFQRYLSSSPTLVIPAIAFRPIVERNSLALLPEAHGGISPALPCRSAQAVGINDPKCLHVQVAQRSAAAIGEDSLRWD